MTLRWTLLSLLIVALAMGTSACKLPGKKKAAPPVQAQAPTITTTQTASQNPGPPPPSTAEPSRPLLTPGEVTVAENAPPKNLPKPARTAPRKAPKKTIVENEPPAQPAPAPQQQGQLSASISHDDALHQKLDTAQLIESTESTLRGLTRQLNNNEQAMVQHIRSFIKESQAATANGDYERAHGLAVKAHLLSDELTKVK